MQIDKDLDAITRVNVPMETGANATTSSDRIGGLRSGNEIFIPPRRTMQLMTVYCHEVGHTLGDNLSFQAGLKEGEEADVLSIDEVKDPKTRIDLTDEEKEYLSSKIFLNQDENFDPILLTITNKLLKVFTKGKFDPNSIDFHFVSQDELEAKVSTLNISTLSRDSNNNIIAVNSKEGRNSEIPSFTTEFSCMQILENTLIHYGVFSEDQFFIFQTTGSPGHQRARNILSRAFESEGWRMPSMVDISRKKT